MQVQFNSRNAVVIALVLFFIYLAYMLWGPGAPSAAIPDLFVDLDELIKYSILAAETGGHAVRLVAEEKRLLAKSKGETKEGAKEYVTRADLISNQLIQQVLERFPGVSLVSEEKTRLPDKDLDAYRTDINHLWQSNRANFERIRAGKVALSRLGVWVDPLDATQEYTEDLVQYVTVMICVTVDGRPRAGVVHRPFFNQTVWGVVGEGVHPAAATAAADEQPIVVSRSHSGAVASLAEKAFGKGVSVEPAGGAGYKTLRVLNGTASMYVHQTAIKKWDLCAPDALITAAGGRMVTLFGHPISYAATDRSVVNEDGLLVALHHVDDKLHKLQSAVNSNR